MKTQKFNLAYRLNLQKERNGEFPIYMRIFIDGLKTEISTKHYIKETFWDPKKTKVRPNATNSHFLNANLEKTKHELHQLFLELIAKDFRVTPQTIKNHYLGINDKPKEKTICDAFDYHNLKMADVVNIGKISEKTLMRYKITKNKVVAFMRLTYKKDDIFLFDVRLRFVTEFEHFLLTVQKIQTNTAHKYIKNLKKIMNMSVGLDWIPSNPLNQFKCTYSSPDREILNQEELNQIIEKKFSTNRMNEVRDVFIFCCYTGFAYSDIYQFEQNAITKGLDGEYWLSTNRQKTGTKESVPLLPIPLEIIQKYQENDYCVKFNKLLPVNSNQRYNTYLKELADVCGINKHLTSHIARHTFATTITLANGVPIETVSSMLGHTNIHTTQIYAKVVEQKVSDDMKALRTKLNMVLDKVKKIG
jgi:site-specific recombinase XerD